MNPNQTLWEKGDFTRVADSMRESGEALVAKLGITKGMKILDLGCGDGTTALPEARFWVRRCWAWISRGPGGGGKQACASGGVGELFQEGDAMNLSRLKAQSFDLVVSIFGAMLA